MKKSVSRTGLSPEKKKGERSLVKFPIIDFDPKRFDKEEKIEESKKKPKPEMIDAWT
jgi:hypothetical protein